MKYWALVENDIVVNVIVADDEFVLLQDGEWIETDINTRGNVHYDENGNPDNGVPIRKNYAGIGYKYDRNNDAFYDPVPPEPEGWTLDTQTFTWVSNLPKGD